MLIACLLVPWNDPREKGFLILLSVFRAKFSIWLPGWTVNLVLTLDNRDTQNKVSLLTLREARTVRLGHTTFSYQKFVEKQEYFP